MMLGPSVPGWASNGVEFRQGPLVAYAHARTFATPAAARNDFRWRRSASAVLLQRVSSLPVERTGLRLYRSVRPLQMRPKGRSTYTKYSFYATGVLGRRHYTYRCVNVGPISQEAMRRQFEAFVPRAFAEFARVRRRQART